MSLPHAILTALLERPSSGLELTRRFDKSIGFFWSATHQQIYRELAKLEQGGLIRAVPGPPTRGQKKEYEVLPAGREELAGWVAERQDPKPVRDALLLRLRAAAVVGAAGLDVELQRHLELHQRQLADYTAIEERDFPPGKADEENRLHHLVLRAGIGLEASWIDWLTQARAELAGAELAGAELAGAEPADGEPA
ncbi:PadR family transcriptional regulator [Kitasatospora mediocidica]|uniref:PadR family transcriptional regulator n=1 Tax=Kitasatospora mediocidica TaxID=58352 RepID=UPI00055F1F37|nr:PadR family transcriptional regulator [Kitasatospora mediocidica]